MRVLCASSVRVGVCGVCVCSGDLKKHKKHKKTHTHTQFAAAAAAHQSPVPVAQSPPNSAPRLRAAAVTVQTHTWRMEMATSEHRVPRSTRRPQPSPPCIASRQPSSDIRQRPESPALLQDKHRHHRHSRTEHRRAQSPPAQTCDARPVRALVAAGHDVRLLAFWRSASSRGPAGRQGRRWPTRPHQYKQRGRPRSPRRRHRDPCGRAQS